MMQDKLYSIIDKVTSASGKRLELLELAKSILGDYEEEDLQVTPTTRCEVLIKVLNTTNPDACQDELTYIENMILFDKGTLLSLERLNSYANINIQTSKTSTSVNVVVDWVELTDSTNILQNLVDLVNELIFSLSINVEITLIIHNLKTSIEVVDIATSINQTRIINLT